MKVKDITDDTLKDFCGISDDDSDGIIAVLKGAAIAFIKEYTGLSTEEVEKLEDIDYAYMVLVNDMYTNREYNSAQARKGTMLNPTVKTILEMHCKNNVGWIADDI